MTQLIHTISVNILQVVVVIVVVCLHTQAIKNWIYQGPIL